MFETAFVRPFLRESLSHVFMRILSQGELRLPGHCGDTPRRATTSLAIYPAACLGAASRGLRLGGEGSARARPGDVLLRTDALGPKPSSTHPKPFPADVLVLTDTEHACAETVCALLASLR